MDVDLHTESLEELRKYLIINEVCNLLFIKGGYTFESISEFASTGDFACLRKREPSWVTGSRKEKVELLIRSIKK